MVKKFLPKLSIGLKIYGLAATILFILLGVALSNYQQMRRVNQNVLALAEYTAPLKKHIASINIHALEQEVHFERMLRILEMETIDTEHFEREQQRFASLGTLVDQELESALELAATAIANASDSSTLVRFAQLRPWLEIVEADHQYFQDQALKVVNLLQTEQDEAAHFLDLELEQHEEIFNQRIYTILLDLDQFAAETAQNIEAQERKLLRFNLWLTAIATVSGLTLASLLTLRLINPVKKLVQGA
ncbi:MAG: hypothetical protein AAGG51_19985 [Cyanobacteria bacterium P01_G01_bin.54]